MKPSCKNIPVQLEEGEVEEEEKIDHNQEEVKNAEQGLFLRIMMRSRCMKILKMIMSALVCVIKVCSFLEKVYIMEYLETLA